MNIKIVALSLLAITPVCKAGPIDAPLKVTLHDSRGFSAASAPNSRLRLELRTDHTQFHFRISNTTDQTLTLWKPHCPKGDRAIVVEFRETANPEKVLRAINGQFYTGGMGIPKVFGLAGHDDLIVNLNFTSGMDWMLPMQIPKDARLDMEVRVSYRSSNLTAEELQRFGHNPPQVEKVWEGDVFGAWQPITIFNQTGKAIEKMAP